MLIFGFRVRFSGKETIVFFCPTCGGDRQGQRGVVRRWFTLFFLPVIPLNTVAEAVECSTCSSRFVPEVADRPTTAALGDLLHTVVRVLNVMVVAAGDVHHPAVRSSAVSNVAGHLGDYDDATLTNDLLSVDSNQLEAYVTPLDESLSMAGKESVMAGLVRTAQAGGEPFSGQRSIIERTGRALGLTPAHVAGLLFGQPVEGRQPPPSTSGPSNL